MALAVPTRYGQDMIVSQGQDDDLVWRSIDNVGKVWFEGHFEIPSGKYLEGNDNDVGKILEEMFAYILSVHPSFFDDKKGTIVETHLDFPRDWGLGSSSTMIYNLAKWANVDAHSILTNTMGGSGYDIACAGSNSPILYQLQNKTPFSKQVAFNPTFKDHLYFIHLGKKQNSRSGIKYYRDHVANNPKTISNISIITNRLLHATTLNEFQTLVKHHEKIVSELLDMKRVKKDRFPDYWGQVKSLGAWGGDFVMATSKRSYKETETYFKEKGYPVFFSYKEMIL